MRLEITGETVSSYSEAYRHECECRAILRMATRDERAKAISAVAARRGTECAVKLKRDALLIHMLRLPAERLDDGDAPVDAFLNNIAAKEGLQFARSLRESYDAALDALARNLENHLEPEIPQAAP